MFMKIFMVLFFITLKSFEEQFIFVYVELYKKINPYPV